MNTHCEVVDAETRQLHRYKCTINTCMLDICALIHEYTHHPQFANDSKELSIIKQLSACALSPYLSLTLSLSPPLQFD